MQTPLPDNSSFEREHTSIRKILSRKIKWIQRQLNKCHEELTHCYTWEDIYHEADLLQSNFHLIKRGMLEVSVHDWNNNQQKIITLNPKNLPQEEISLRYRCSRKLKKAIPYLEQRLATQEKNLLTFDQLNKELAEIRDLYNLHQWLLSHPELKSKECVKVKQAQKQVQEPQLPYHEYNSFAGLKIWVGKNAKSNDTMTFKLAKGSDWWLHTTHCPGSHVIICVNKSQEPDNDTLQDAIQLALFYSKAKASGEGEVCITQRKFISKFGKGQPGKVQISKHKIVFAKINKERIDKIKKSYLRP